MNLFLFLLSRKEMNLTKLLITIKEGEYDSSSKNGEFLKNSCSSLLKVRYKNRVDKLEFLLSIFRSILLLRSLKFSRFLF